MAETDKTMTDINICLSCDDNYSIHAGVVIASILKNSKQNENIVIYILDGGISEQRKNEILSLKNIKNCDINFVAINPSNFNDYTRVHTHKYITLATYYRLKLATLLPDVNKIIYLDCDMVVNSSLENLFNTNIENCFIAGVQDLNEQIITQKTTYVNAGVLIFNLDLIRKEGIEEKFLKYTLENFDTIKYGDQTIINEVCKGKIKVLEDTWNVQTSDFMNRSSYTSKPSIIHYIAKNKPWCHISLCYFKNYYIKYLQLTPWRKSSLDIFRYKYIDQILSIFKFIIHRPTFFIQKKFYNALFQTYFN